MNQSNATPDQKQAACHIVLISAMKTGQEAESRFPDLKKIHAMAMAAAACWAFALGINPPAGGPDIETAIAELEQAGVFREFEHQFDKVVKG